MNIIDTNCSCSITIGIVAEMVVKRHIISVRNISHRLYLTLEYRINGGGVRIIGGLEMVQYNNDRGVGTIMGAGNGSI